MWDIWTTVIAGIAFVVGTVVYSFFHKAGEDGWEAVKGHFRRKQAKKTAKMAAGAALLDNKKVGETKS